jgi:hypothetical protein
MMMVNVPHVDIVNAKAKCDSQGQLSDQASLDSLRQLLIELKALTLQFRS